MARVHEVLRWANRRAVAEEVTMRGYRLSGETLNRWVREEKEFPAIVERIVFELFGIAPDTKKEPPPWAEAMRTDIADGLRLNRRLIESLLPPEREAEVAALIADFEESLRQRAAADPPVRTGRSGRDGGSPQAQADESPPVPNGGR